MSALTAPFHRWRSAAPTRPRGWATKIAGAWLILVVVLALAAPVLSLPSPDAVNLGAVNAGMTSQHPLGADQLGRDTLSRLIWGARTGLLGPLLVIILTTILGTIMGVAAAWRGGRTDAMIGATIDILLAFPGLLLAILAVAIFGVGLTAPIIALAIAYTPYLGRLVRSAAIRERSQPYIAALSVQGFGGLHICVRHLLPNISPLIRAQAALGFGYALVDLAAISFLGLGVQPPTPDWGSMMSDSQAGLVNGHPQVAIYSGLTIILTVVAVNVIGEAAVKKRP